MTDLRDKIARAIHDSPSAQAQYLKAGIAPHGFENCRYSEQYFNDADAVLAVLDTERAEAQVVTVDQIVDELAGHPIGSGYYQTAVGVADARAMADAVMALLRGDGR